MLKKVCSLVMLMCSNVCAEHPFKFIDKPFTTVRQIYRFMPKERRHAEALVDAAQEDLKASMDAIKALPKDAWTYKATFGCYDRALRRVDAVWRTLNMLGMIVPDKDLREACREQDARVCKVKLDLAHDREVFGVLKGYAELREQAEVEPNLGDQERYYIDKLVEELTLEGLGLDDETFERLSELKQELSVIEKTYYSNLNDVTTKLELSAEELVGVSEGFLSGCDIDKSGKYLVGLDGPAYVEIMGNCSISPTREKMLKAFNSRAWPENEQILSQVLKTRAEIAKLLGFQNSAQKEIKMTIADLPDTVLVYLDELGQKAQPKLAQELDMLRADLPEGVELNEQGQFKPWDLGYTYRQYKKKHLDIDPNYVKEFFPLESTISGLFEVYQNLLSVEFKIHKDVGLWHPECQIIEVVEKENQKVLGFIILDLHPRDSKYSHACAEPLVKGLATDDGNLPDLAIVIVNLPKGTAGRPALLTLGDVSTFFHEFGHAMHDVLGITKVASRNGMYGVLEDFAETPSMMFEEWIEQPEVLKKLSKHYQTGESMPDELVTKIVNSRSINSGYFFVSQVNLSLFSLLCHSTVDGDVDYKELWRHIGSQTLPGIDVGLDSKKHASFIHLMEYSARYYIYMWSLMFACDIFNRALELGLDSPEAGRLVRGLLSAGGGVRADILVKQLLGRPASIDAMVKRFGLE